MYTVLAGVLCYWPEYDRIRSKHFATKIYVIRTLFGGI